MVFKSDKQRKAIMAMMRGETKSSIQPEIITSNNPRITRGKKFRTFTTTVSIPELNVFRRKDEIKARNINEALKLKRKELRSFRRARINAISD